MNEDSRRIANCIKVEIFYCHTERQLIDVAQENKLVFKENVAFMCCYTPAEYLGKLRLKLTKL